MLQAFWEDEIVEQLEWYNIEVICFIYFIYSFGIFATVFMGFIYLFIFMVCFIRSKNMEFEDTIVPSDEEKVMFDRFIINIDRDKDKI